MRDVTSAREAIPNLQTESPNEPAASSPDGVANDIKPVDRATVTQAVDMSSNPTLFSPSTAQASPPYYYPPGSLSYDFVHTYFSSRRGSSVEIQIVVPKCGGLIGGMPNTNPKPPQAGDITEEASELMTPSQQPTNTTPPKPLRTNIGTASSTATRTELIPQWYLNSADVPNSLQRVLSADKTVLFKLTVQHGRYRLTAAPTKDPRQEQDITANLDKWLSEVGYARNKSNGRMYSLWVQRVKDQQAAAIMNEIDSISIESDKDTLSDIFHFFTSEQIVLCISDSISGNDSLGDSYRDRQKQSSDAIKAKLMADPQLLQALARKYNVDLSSLSYMSQSELVDFVITEGIFIRHIH